MCVVVAEGSEQQGNPRTHLECIEVQQQREILTLPLDRQPESVTFDPRTYVLMDAEVTRADGSR